MHRSARRAEAAIASQRESTALAELTHTLLGSTDQMSLLLRRAQDMFGAQWAAIVRRPDKDTPAPDIVAATDGFTLADPTSQTTRERADDQHDLVLQVATPLPADQRQLLAAYAIHAGAILHRRSLQASAGTADALARDNRARTALLSAVSHDLRTPLSSIKAAIGSLRSTEVTFTPEDQAELEAIIEESADRLETLIGNLLDMSRLQAGALVAHPRDVDLAEIIPHAVAALPDSAPVSWDIATTARIVHADPGLLDRVLGNVLENAVRHAPAGEPVRLTTSWLDKTVQIRVIDTGAGMAEEGRERMFQPFQRLGDAPDGDGVGPGLAVARGFTEAMNGLIEVEDTPGGGLTMVLTFPAAAPDAGVSPDPGAAEVVTRT